MRLKRLALFIMLACSIPWRAAVAQCDDWRNGPFSAHAEGLNGQVLASTVWTPPGFTGSLVVVGGTFTMAGELPVSNIAAWDGASWRALGSGVNGAVYGLAVRGNELIVGGQFAAAGGAPASNIASFDGAAWHALGSGLDSPCQGLGVYNNDVIAGGSFTNAGGVAAANVARWDGSSWHAMGSGTNGVVTNFQVYNGNLIAGGGFTNAGGVAASRIASWNGSAWSSLPGGGLNSGCACMTVFNNELVVGGGFTAAGSVSAKRIAHWNGSTWGAFGSGFNNSVDALAVYNGVLVAGGVFTDAIGTGDFLASWNGSTWNSFGGVGTPVPFGTPAVWALSVFGSDLIVGGYFGSAGTVPAGYVAKWNNSSFSTLQVAPPWIFAMTPFTGRMVAAGTFIQSLPNSSPAYNLAAFDGVNLTRFDSGLNGAARALLAYNTTLGFPVSHLVVGGDFTTAGGVAANRIAIWNVSDVIFQSGWFALGAGFDQPVRAVERFNNAIYAGGDFINSGATNVNRIAQWNGSSWVSLAGGMNGTVNALKVYNGLLYAGGSFTTAGGVSTGGLARWNGTSWSNVGGFFGGTVYTLEIHNGELVIGGSFPGLAGSPNIAKYNSGSGVYSNLGSGGANGSVQSLKSENGLLYVGGNFDFIGGVGAQHIARWSSGSGWSEVRGGVNAGVYALGALHNEVHAGGLLGSAHGGTVPVAGWARYTEDGSPWISQSPSFQQPHCGENVAYGVAAATGYGGLSYQWRRNGTPLVNGPTGTGSTISGATTANLVIANVSTDDEGSYDAVVSNTCGSSASFATNMQVYGCCLGDLDSSETVTVDDLFQVINSWGTCPGCPADIVPPGGNGFVDVDDLFAVINHWGACP